MTSSRVPDNVVSFGELEVRLDSRELFRNGSRVRVPDQSFQVLKILLAQPGQLVTREELRRRLWAEDTFVDFDHGLNNSVNRLREALRDSATAPRYIETLPRRGYRFIAPVAWSRTDEHGGGDLADPAGPAAKANSAEGGSTGVSRVQSAPPLVTVASTPTASAPRRRRATLVVLGIAAMAAMAAGIGVLDFAASRARRVTPPPLSSIVVIPFEDLAAPESGNYFAEGMTDALITDLAQFPSLKVISRTSAVQYRHPAKTAPQIARELQVGAILEGTVVRSGSRVRVNVQLIDAIEDRHLWAQSYERDVRDILTVQQDVAGAVAQQVGAQLRPTPESSARAARTVNPDAYEAYLRGRYDLLPPYVTADRVQRAVTYFQEASRIDPGYAPAWAGLAEAYYQLGFAYFVHTLSPAESIRLSEAAALKAVELDSLLAEAHLALARVRLAQWRWAEAAQESGRAMELDPADSRADSVYSMYLVAVGRAADAVAVVRRALDRDPFSADLNAKLSWWLFEGRDYEGSLRQCRVEVDLNPARPNHRCFAQVYEQQGRYAEAIDRYRRLVELFADPKAAANARAELARACARSGSRAEAQRLLRDVEGLDRPDTAYPLALAYAALHDRDRAFHYLERAFMERSGWLALVNVEPALDPLRSDPRFKDIVRRMGLGAAN
jgi:TolB-like protein/DNA-binding winged helix-turn-helix (wHTH) protein/tetratricopeptide (TPR) repeat protein